MKGVEKPREPAACVCLVQAVTPAQLGRAWSLTFLLGHHQSTENSGGTLVMSTVRAILNKNIPVAFTVLSEGFRK